MTTSADVRARLVDVLRRDLIGPGAADEILHQSPSRWYLTGFLVPASQPEVADDEGQDQLELLEKPSGGDDEGAPERPAAKKVYFPSSFGVSVLVDEKATALDVDVRWGDYERTGGTEGGGGAADIDESQVEGAGKKKRVKWERHARTEHVPVQLKPGSSTVPVLNGAGLELVVSVEPVGNGDGALELPSGTRSVSVFLVNRREPRPKDVREEGYAFQASLTLTSPVPFVARPNLRGRDTGDNDERVADLQYRRVFELAVGHGVATHAVLTDSGCREVTTTWMPSAEVAKVAPAHIPGVETSMEALAAAASAAELKKMLEPLVAQYADWLASQKKVAASDPSIKKRRADVAADLLKRAELARKRIARGIALLDDEDVRTAFCTANRVMAVQARRRTPARYQKPEDVPRWRVFQLGFLLMNLAGIADAKEPDRSLVDLIFFPTGGGKTEAYLGLAAFTLVLRRLKNPGLQSAGVCVLMRYTLRLLTLDQLSRACTLICALELERQKDVTKLGTWPFEIGLWVGKAATPNRMGKKGDDDDSTARAVTKSFQRDDRKRMPIPLENCPWCNARFTSDSFRLHPDENKPLELHVQCVSRDCVWNRSQHLPIVAVDDSIYRRLPCFLIATVDKFAALPWEGRTGTLFGKVDRHDKAGFYGPCDPEVGAKLPMQLLPPDLVIQDELHLISGPLGTMVGLYETAIDALSARQLDGVEVRPKIVASTATVRRAESQIQALFGRNDVAIFPPPGPSLEDSFFAKTQTLGEQAGRLYIGLAAQGQSLKVVLLRTYITLLSAALAAYNNGGGAGPGDKNPADPYMTLLGYFSSLRELGGSRRIIEDEVRARLAGYSKRDQRAGAFADRKIQEDVVELTSRVPTNKVADAKRRLGLPMSAEDRVDVAIATNMISVGLDITRLGLMVVLGQPVTTAEYIQASSRVGRDDAKPGLVITLFNIYRPRDRSHYERFEAYHASFYRAVEATSVTPFSPRALDRGLPGVMVALARQSFATMTPPTGAANVSAASKEVAKVAEILAKRAEAHDLDLDRAEIEATAKTVRDRTMSLLDSWKHVSAEKDTGLQYQREETGAPPLLFMPLDPQLAEQSKHGRRFKANRSLRDVELSVNLWVRRLDTGASVEADDGEEP